MKMVPAWQSFVYEQPSSFITAMSVMNLLALAYLGISETIGKHLPYSKFWNVNSQISSANQMIKFSSRTAMLIAYTPAFLVAVASFVIFPENQIRFLLVKSALIFHFFKRLFEVLFVHRYSGGMALSTLFQISFSYFNFSASMIYIQHLSQGFQEPLMDLKCLGVLIFLVGICGNFYHHYLLSKLREKNEKGYKIPKGGLFNLVVCPHYLFEMIEFLGLSFVSQTLFSFSFTIGSAFYLIGRSYATKKWYISKFENFPKEVKALIPYIF